MKVKKSFIYDDGGDWQVFNLQRDRCEGLTMVARSKFRSVRYGDEMHVHRRFVEMFLCMKGCVRYETEEGEVRLLPEQIFASRPDQPHRRISSPKGMCLYRAVFSIPQDGKNVLGLSAAESRFFIDAFSSFSRRVYDASPRVRPAFERLFAACETGKTCSVSGMLNVKAAALELLLSLVETMQCPRQARVALNSRVESVVRKIDGNPAADYSVPLLARESAMSSVALNRIFKRLTGLTPHAYVMDVRIRHARRDIESGLPISAVAAKYRFPSASHFSTVFRRIIGRSPRDCRGIS